MCDLLTTKVLALSAGLLVFGTVAACLYKCSSKKPKDEEPEPPVIELREAVLTIDDDSETDEEFFSDEEY